MPYNQKVQFTEVNTYGGGPDEDDVYTVEGFSNLVEHKMLIDYDGYGHPVKDRLADPAIFIYPSRIKDIPADATHIIWFNR